jgi:hypothetical protein
MLQEQRTWRIGEAAEELAISKSWLRFGERLGALPLARRTPSGWRYYTAEDLERLRRLKRVGCGAVHAKERVGGGWSAWCRVTVRYAPIQIGQR